MPRSWLLLAAAPLVPGNAPDPAKPASPATIAAQRGAGAALPAEDGRAAEFAARGFIATLPDPVIRSPAGKQVWNADSYAGCAARRPIRSILRCGAR